MNSFRTGEIPMVEEYYALAIFVKEKTWNPEFNRLVDLAKVAIASKDGIFFMGNGGSASEATHLAAEFVGKCVADHEPWLAVSLNDSISAITAIANDWSFDEIFVRQVKAHAKPNSLFIGLSTSGESNNVIRGLDEARKQGCKTALFTTTQGAKKAHLKVDVTMSVPTESTPRAQEIHLFWGHLMAEIIESQ